MDDYISRQTAIKAIMSQPREAYYPPWWADIIQAIPAADVVTRDCYDRILWENDIMKEQLASIGKKFGEKMDGVRPVRRGRWIKTKGDYITPGGDPVWECSECGKGCHVYGIEHGTYGADVSDGQWVSCPNCGADMREEGSQDGG